METRVGSYNQAFRGWIKGQSVQLGVSGLWSCPRELLTACHPSLILVPFLRGLNPCEPWGARKLGETGSIPLLALRAQVTAPASRALGVNVQRGTTVVVGCTHGLIFQNNLLVAGLVTLHSILL